MTGGSGFPPFCSEMGVVGRISSFSFTMVKQRLLQANLTSWAPGQHELHYDAQNTPCEEHTAHRSVNIVVDRVSTVDHQLIHNLHGLGSLSLELPSHHNLTALDPSVHNEPQHTEAGPPRPSPPRSL